MLSINLPCLVSLVYHYCSSFLVVQNSPPVSSRYGAISRSLKEMMCVLCILISDRSCHNRLLSFLQLLWDPSRLAKNV